MSFDRNEDLLRNPVQRIKPSVLPRFNMWVKTLCKAFDKNSEAFALYRIHIAESLTRGGIVELEFLASDEAGAFKNPQIKYDLKQGEMYTDRVAKKFNFTNEKEVSDAIESFLENLSEVKYPISQVYMDVNLLTSIKRCFFRDDPLVPDNKVLFLESGDSSAIYSYPEASVDTGCSPVLCGSWLGNNNK